MAKAAAAAAAAAEVSARLVLEAGHVRLQLRVGGREALNFGADCSSPEEDDEGITIEELTAEALLRRRMPQRASALAAASAREGSELELKRALAAAEAGEVERRESWRLAEQLKAERAEKAELAERAEAAEAATRAAEAAREAAEQQAADERAAAAQAAAEAVASVKRTAGEQLAKHQVRPLPLSEK